MLGRNENLQLNPNVKITREKTWQKTLAKVVPQLLVGADKNLPYQGVKVTVGYVPENEQRPVNDQYNLFIAVNSDDRQFIRTLMARLNDYFPAPQADQPSVQYREDVFLELDAQGINGTYDFIYINHAYLPRFFNEICRAVSLYADNHYSLLRDFYRVEPSVSKSNDLYAPALKNIFDTHHKPYQSSEKMQTRLMNLAHLANGVDRGAGLFKKVHPSVSSQEELYQRMNALVHAYHLGDVGQALEGFSNRLQDKDERARLTESYSDGLLSVVHHGDMFYEISEAFKQNPNAKLAYVSPDNLFRCGSAALVGNRGSVEESLVRVSNYVPQALAQAELHKDDPQAVLCQLYENLQPTGGTLVLGSACGVYYLAGQTIPEYIKREEARAYSEFAYERLHLAREMARREGYDDKYPEHKTMPHLVPNVKFLDAQGVVRSVSVMGMVGIDGNPRHEGSIASQVGFDDSDLQDKHGYDQNGQYNMLNAIEFYKAQWMAAFNEILVRENHNSKFILNPVGCGAFDPSKDGSMLTRASAQGFAEAFKAKMDELKHENISLVLPIYDMRKVYPHYQEALYATLRVQPTVACIGGTIASCELAIRKKYDESRGGKYNMEGKSFAQILAHGVNKDGKTRRVLLDLKYIQMNAQNQLVVGEHAPDCVKELYRNIFSALEEPAILKAIINAYTANRKYIHLPVKDGKDDFDIYSASLEDIIRHATSEGKGGKITRAALRNLNYLVSVDTSAGRRLVLNEHGFGNDCPPAPALFIDKYKAVMAPPANNPQPQ